MTSPRSIITSLLRTLVVPFVIGSCWLGTSCNDRRTPEEAAPTFQTDMQPLFAARCGSCHAAGAGAWNAATYVSAIGCLKDGRWATDRREAPLLQALESNTHAGVVSDTERRRIAAWIEAGSPSSRGSVHSAHFSDPRSDASHARSLRARRWQPMLSADDPEACGRCHDGVPSRPANVRLPAPGAPACTSCHTDPGGVFACGTCHGSNGRPYPPRDLCFHPEESARGRAHAAHVEDSKSSRGLACSTCHPSVDPIRLFGGSHGNGVVDVVVDPAVAGRIEWQPGEMRCGGGCHGRAGGARPSPLWTDTAPMQCGDCHGAPPVDHYPGACSSCHKEANAAGSSVGAKVLHMNGRVDLGDGSNACGACHGHGEDPWPEEGAHARHRTPENAASVPCETCHEVPTGWGRGIHPRGGGARVLLRGRARTQGSPADYTNGTCRDVYCHGGKLAGTVAAAPSWMDASGAARQCGACHGIPPATQHPAGTQCETCHGPVSVLTAAGPVIDPERKDHHVDGIVDSR